MSSITVQKIIDATTVPISNLPQFSFIPVFDVVDAILRNLFSLIPRHTLTFAMNQPVNAIECKKRQRKPNSRALVNSERITNHVPVRALGFFRKRVRVCAERVCFSVTEHSLQGGSSSRRTLWTEHGQKLCFFVSFLRKNKTHNYNNKYNWIKRFYLLSIWISPIFSCTFTYLSNN